MSLFGYTIPYARPRLIEFHEQPWFPSFLRQPIQNMLTAVWITRFPIFQKLAPYEAVSDVLEKVVDELEWEDRLPLLDGEGFGSGSGKWRGRMRIVDCCSGAGGPMPTIEKRLKWVDSTPPQYLVWHKLIRWGRSDHRKLRSLPPIPILLSDLHPHLSAWSTLTSASPSQSLSYLPYPVDATHAPEAMKQDRHFRTFCLAFHHFDEAGARGVIEDAMRTADGIGFVSDFTGRLGGIELMLMERAGYSNCRSLI